MKGDKKKINLSQVGVEPTPAALWARCFTNWATMAPSLQPLGYLCSRLALAGAPTSTTHGRSGKRGASFKPQAWCAIVVGGFKTTCAAQALHVCSDSELFFFSHCRTRASLNAPQMLCHACSPFSGKFAFLIVILTTFSFLLCMHAALLGNL